MTRCSRLSFKQLWRLPILVSCLLNCRVKAFTTPDKHKAPDPIVLSTRSIITTQKPPNQDFRSRGKFQSTLRYSQELLALRNPDDTDYSSDEDRKRGILVLCTVPLAWGSFEPVARWVYALEPPIPGLVFAPCYYFVAAFALSLLSFATSSKKGKSSEFGDTWNDSQQAFQEMPTTGNNLSDAALPILGGLELGFYLFLGNALQLLGLKTLNSDRVAFLIQLTTIFVPLVQGIAARNLFAIPTRTWTACIIALCGVGVLGLEGNEDVLLQQGDGLASTQQFLSQGDFLVIGSALAYTFHCIRLEKYAKTTRAVTLAACKATTETLLSVILVLGLLGYSSGEAAAVAASESNFLANFASETRIEISSFISDFPQRLMHGSTPPSMMIPAAGAILWTGLITVGYTIYAQSYGQSRVNPSTANLIYTVQPIWTALIAFFLLGETLGPSGFIGGGFIGLAVFLVITGEEQPPPNAENNLSGQAVDDYVSVEIEEVLEVEKQ